VRQNLVTRSTSRLVLLALSLSCLMATQLAVGSGAFKRLLTGGLPWQAPLLFLLLVVVTTGAIINALTAIMRPDSPRRAGTAAAGALMVATSATIIHVTARLPIFLFFSISLLSQALYTFCLASVLIRCLKVTGKWAKYPPYAAGSAVTVFGAAGGIGQSWISLEVVTSGLPLVRDIALVLVPLAVIGALAGIKSLRLDRNSAWESLKLRLPMGGSSTESRLTWLTFVVCACGLVLSLVINIIMHSAPPSGGPTAWWTALPVFSLGWFGLGFLSLGELHWFLEEQRQGLVTARLATSSARHFLRRHLSDQKNWAATAGFRTTNFSIDHDPGNLLQTKLPASIMQIRGEEIQRCVNEVLGKMQLHSYVVGNRLFGALDPEHSRRPCIDTLKLLAALYLDAGPLVERRIAGLTSVLPIVEPAFAEFLQAKNISALVRRSLWFFHFDFGWIDQHVTHSPRATRYDVRIEMLSSHLRHTMIEHSEGNGAVGNCVWLGPEARDRLLQEATGLAPIVSASPITISDNGQNELLMFTIKFEQLIPRLQRHFDLDSMRQALFDFEPSPENRRLHNLLGLQIGHAKSCAGTAWRLGAGNRRRDPR